MFTTSGSLLRQLPIAAALLFSSLATIADAAAPGIPTYFLGTYKVGAQKGIIDLQVVEAVRPAVSSSAGSQSMGRRTCPRCRSLAERLTPSGLIPPTTRKLRWARCREWSAATEQPSKGRCELAARRENVQCWPVESSGRGSMRPARRRKHSWMRIFTAGLLVFPLRCRSVSPSEFVRSGPQRHRSRFDGSPMKQRLRVRSCLFLLAVLGLSSRFCSSGRSDERASDATILVCGMDEVFVMDAARPADDERPEKLWSWKGSDSSDLPASLKRQFATTDECKPVRNGRQILISSSGGGCALVDYASRRVLWSASVPNAHSVELLPQGRIAVASSTASSGRGDRIVVFNENGEGDVVWQGPLQSAHGLVWDDARQRLWALGFDVLESYELADWSSASPSLKRSTSTPLPSRADMTCRPFPGRMT